MSWQYEYTPYIWPMLASAILCMLLGIYAWNRRSSPGALPFAVMLFFVMFWSLGVTLQMTAVDVGTQIFWLKFTALIKLPTATAELFFGIQYTGLGRFLTRRNVILLSIPAIFILALGLTNEFHHYLWLGYRFDGELQPIRSTLTFVMASYSFVLALVMIVLFVRLFIRSPQHRWPVTLILVELVIARTAVLLYYLGINPVAPMDPVVISWNAGAILYAAALFGFRIFDEINIARQAAITQMPDGMVMLDMQGRIVSLNPAAQTFLGKSKQIVAGNSIETLLPEFSVMIESTNNKNGNQFEISRGEGVDTRRYTLMISELQDWQKLPFGRLLLLHDVTEHLKIQVQLVENQRAMAMLKEREYLARELHDSIGQVLGYAGFQVEAISKLISDGKIIPAISMLDRLRSIVGEAHTDLREYILSLHTAPAADKPIFSAIRNYLEGYTSNYGIVTQLTLDERLGDEPFRSDTRMQVFRILQEALSNARKHGKPHCVNVDFLLEDHQILITIQDDGVGFDTVNRAVDAEGHYGLQFMRERAEAEGGSLEVISLPGQGTHVIARLPISRETTGIERANNDD